MPYLNSSIFFVMNKIHTVHAIRQGIALNPLICILSALRTNTFYSVDFLHINL